MMIKPPKKTRKKTTKPKTARRLSPEAAARIRSKVAEKIVALDQKSYPARKLARAVLLATARYMKRHRQGPEPDDIENTAAARIYETYSGFVEAIEGGASQEQILGGLGIYVTRLELLLAQADSDLEKLSDTSSELIAIYKGQVERREKIISLQEEQIALFEGWVEHLKGQLVNAGITSTDYIPPD
jgi:hypothetical protein